MNTVELHIDDTGYHLEINGNPPIAEVLSAVSAVAGRHCSVMWYTGDEEEPLHRHNGLLYDLIESLLTSSWYWTNAASRPRPLRKTCPRPAMDPRSWEPTP